MSQNKHRQTTFTRSEIHSRAFSWAIGRYFVVTETCEETENNKVEDTKFPLNVEIDLIGWKHCDFRLRVA